MAFPEHDLETVLRELMTRWDIPGMAAGVVLDKEIRWVKTFGVQSLQTKAPVTSETIFCVQSISKSLVASAVMQWVERELIALDLPLVHYLPEFHMADDRFHHITSRQILCHTSGLTDIAEEEYIEWVSHPETDEGAAGRFMRTLSEQKLLANPGEEFSYSNIGYNLLGLLISRVAGMPFEECMHKNILIPSGMLSSTFLPQETPSHLLAIPHLRSPQMWVNPVYPYQRADSPSSNLHTTIGDLCRWAITCLNRGDGTTGRILSPASFNLMWAPAAKRSDTPGMFEQMGLGWSLGHYREAKTICHGGAGFGWSAFLLLLPEKDSAAVVMCNEESNAHYRAIRAVADTILGVQPQVNSVSWMVPVSHALAVGGIHAAYECYEQLKTHPTDEYYFFEEDLISLALQLRMAGKPELALDALKLNTTAFPEPN